MESTPISPLRPIEIADDFQWRRIRASVPEGLRVWAEPDGWHVEVATPERRELLRRVFEICQRETSVRAALDRSADIGFLTRDGRKMSDGNFYRHIANQLYCGWVWFQGQVYRSVDEPVIPPEQFWRLQRQLAARRRSGYRSLAPLRLPE